ncbi:hypothetical protein GUJ93_ZPchr0004g39591 [Zizania palustris]|uniref:Uncharacterized protein n=1 Tax=Zizania palustris TaxID=103762 RepID=A0A8J5SIA6_ZIZPA|nr:hypothetical protein GUJ93_ZPchr0004g39591 [Zizania palustris]
MDDGLFLQSLGEEEIFVGNVRAIVDKLDQVSGKAEQIEWSKIQTPTNEVVVPYHTLSPAPEASLSTWIVNIDSTKWKKGKSCAQNSISHPIAIDEVILSPLPFSSVEDIAG